MNNPFLDVRVTREDTRRFEEIAGTWNRLQLHIDSLNEEDLCKLVKWELANQKRLYVVNRVKSRHNRLRDARERSELLADERV